MRLGTYYRAELIESLGLTRNEGRVLDIGGYDGFMLSRLQADQKVSVDIDTIALYPRISYFQGSGLSLPFRDGSFDTVYALDVLEHVEDEQQFVSELMRVLSPYHSLRRRRDRRFRLLQRPVPHRSRRPPSRSISIVTTADIGCRCAPVPIRSVN